MSHELRTPLNAVLGFAQLMETATPLPTPTQKTSIDQILKGGWYLLKLIDEILDLALIESGKSLMEQETIDLSETLRDCQMVIIPMAKTHNITVRFPEDMTKCYVNADKTRIKQVMINLLSNAIKYNRHEGAVTVSCEILAAHRIRVSVSDTGLGLTPALVEQLFQPFNRLGQETSDTEGNGIGLVVSKQLVELMGGVISVRSEVGIGSTFGFELPLLTESATPMQGVGDTIAMAPTASTANVTQRTVLYVEDNPANMALVEHLIQRRNDLKLLTAVDGHLGVQMAQEHLPDLILMDINMPGINGLEALQLLRGNPQTAHIPIIAVSANANLHDIDKGLKAGFIRYLAKPIRINEFMDALDVVLYQIPANQAKSTVML